MMSVRTLDAILLMCQYLQTANLMIAQGADQRKALMLVVKDDFRNTLDSSGLTVDEFFNFCMDENNHHGIVYCVNLAEWKATFLATGQFEKLVKEILKSAQYNN